MRPSDLIEEKTPDGSLTYRDPLTGAHYRSIKGAASESRHVFLEGTRFHEVESGIWRVLELGFGTGMNFATTAQWAQERGIALDYTSLEPNPLPPEKWLIPEAFRLSNGGGRIQSGQITLHVLNQKWQDTSMPEGHFDAYYHDPFAPAVHPDCWRVDCFLWAIHALKFDGILATYGAAGASRRAMRDAGFLIGVLPGAMGKREMTVASQNEARIAHATPWKRKNALKNHR